VRRHTAQEKHQEEALRRFQDASRQHAQAVEVFERAQATREKTEENLRTARLALRRVSEGSI
jgi:RNA polymerase-binding transcription factor DksA